MPCSCGRTACECEEVCHCCPFMCLCEQCYEIRSRNGAYCRPCGGFITRYVCTMIPEWRRSGLYPNYPNLDFLRPHQPSSSTSDERNTERSVPEATDSSSASSRKSSSESSQSPPRGNDTFDDSLIFQMDDIDPPPPPPQVSRNSSTGARSRDFHGSSHFHSNKSASVNAPFDASVNAPFDASVNAPFDLSEMQCRVPRYYRHSPNEAGFMDFIPKFKKPDVNGSKMTESQSEIPIAAQNVAECSHSPGISSFETDEKCENIASSLSTLPQADSNRTELQRETTQGVPGCLYQNSNKTISEHKTESDLTQSHEREMIAKNIPGCSYSNECAPKQAESQINDDVSYAASADEYARDSLPLNLHSSDSAPSTSLVSARSPIRPLSTSAPSTYSLPQPTWELKFSDEKKSIALDTSKQSSTSNLSEFETLRISDSHPIDKSRISESNPSIATVSENMSNGERDDALHGQPGILSHSVESSELNNVEQTESSQPGASLTLSISNSLQLPNPEMSTRRRNSKSDSSTEATSRERLDNSDDEASKNKSPKKK